MTTLRLGTRGSQLALWQARAVANRIEQRGGPACELVTITTSGDRVERARLAAAGGKRLFVKELEDALLRAEIDLAVHSAKDLPADLPQGLELAAVLAREDPRDVLILPRAQSLLRDLAEVLEALGRSPRVGTSSARRVAQIQSLLPEARLLDIRGNLDTRLRKLDEGGYDVLVLAAAGMRRLGLEHRVSATLPVSVCVPAPGQGALAVETRRDDGAVRRAVAPVDDGASHAAITAERALVMALGGGCQLPIGALAVATGLDLELHVVVLSLDGARAVRSRGRAPQVEAAALGERLAAELLASGASEILDQVRRSHIEALRH